MFLSMAQNTMRENAVECDKYHREVQLSLLQKGFHSNKKVINLMYFFKAFLGGKNFPIGQIDFPAIFFRYGLKLKKDSSAQFKSA